MIPRFSISFNYYVVITDRIWQFYKKKKISVQLDELSSKEKIKIK